MSYLKKLNAFQKIIFFLGWLNALNPIFWLVLIIVGIYFNKEDEFWSESTLKVVYVFGWITFIGILFSFIGFISA